MMRIGTLSFFRFRSRSSLLPRLAAALLFVPAPDGLDAFAWVAPPSTERLSDEVVRALIPPAFLVAVLDKGFDVWLDSAIVQYPDLAAAAQGQPETFARARGQARVAFERDVTAQEPAFYRAADKDLAVHLSRSQIIALVSFYRSAAGQKIAQSGPVISHGDVTGQDDTDGIWPIAPPPSETDVDAANTAAFDKTEAATALRAETPILKRLLFQWMDSVRESSEPHLKALMDVNLDRQRFPQGR